MDREEFLFQIEQSMTRFAKRSCPACRGTGIQRVIDTCEKCGGSGKLHHALFRYREFQIAHGDGVFVNISETRLLLISQVYGCEVVRGFYAWLNKTFP